MTPDESLQTIRNELTMGIRLPKCQKCGCMASALKNLATVLPTLRADDASVLANTIAGYVKQIRPIQYACLGCEHCYPAVAQNALSEAFPEFAQAPTLSCNFQAQEGTWPAVVGEYSVLDKTASVAVSTLASVELADELAQRKPIGLAIAGKTETENIGIDKVIKNMITNSALRYLILTGIDPKGHLTGQTLLALAQNGIDEKGRVIGSPAKRAVLRNVSASEIETFRAQVQLIDMIGCTDADEIAVRVQGLARQVVPSCECSECEMQQVFAMPDVPKIIAEETDVIQLDKAGYFVIVPLPERGVINVEYYAYDNALLNVIEGSNARAIYIDIIKHGWVTELSHAAYLGKEITKAELAMKHGFKYVQDGA